MQLALLRELTPEPERRVVSKNVILTPRDLEVIEFIIDCGVESPHHTA